MLSPPRERGLPLCQCTLPARIASKTLRTSTRTIIPTAPSPSHVLNLVYLADPASSLLRLAHHRPNRHRPASPRLRKDQKPPHPIQIRLLRPIRIPMRPQGLLHRRNEIRIFPWQLSLIPAPGEIPHPQDRRTHHLRRRRVFQAFFEKFFHSEIETMLRPIQRLDPLIKNLQSLQSVLCTFCCSRPSLLGRAREAAQ